MHFYNFNINDFNASTRHLSHIERALYRDLIDMYYQNERPICDDFDNLCRKLIAKSDEEKQALQNVLNDFFVIKKLKGDKALCWHHNRIDRELKKYKFRQTPTNATTNENQTPTNATTNANQTQCDRQQTHKQKVNYLVNALRNKGIKANSRMRIGELQTLFDAHCKQASNENQTPTNATTNDTNAVSQVYNQKPITNNHKLNIKTSITQSADADAVVCAGVELNEHQAEETQQKPNTKLKKADAWKALLAENGIVGQLADDYVAIRVAKNAPLTATAMEGLKREAAKAGMTLEQAITYSTEQGWMGFKAEWLLNKVFGGGNQSKPQNRINDLPKHTQGGAFLAKDIF